jgi:hypothetical protein
MLFAKSVMRVLTSFRRLRVRLGPPDDRDRRDGSTMRPVPERPALRRPLSAGRQSPLSVQSAVPTRRMQVPVASGGFRVRQHRFVPSSCRAGPASPTKASRAGQVLANACSAFAVTAAPISIFDRAGACAANLCKRGRQPPCFQRDASGNRCQLFFLFFFLGLVECCVVWSTEFSSPDEPSSIGNCRRRSSHKRNHHLGQTVRQGPWLAQQTKALTEKRMEATEKAAVGTRRRSSLRQSHCLAGRTRNLHGSRSNPNSPGSSLPPYTLPPA